MRMFSSEIKAVYSRQNKGVSTELDTVILNISIVNFHNTSMITDVRITTYGCQTAPALLGAPNSPGFSELEPRGISTLTNDSVILYEFISKQSTTNDVVLKRKISGARGASCAPHLKRECIGRHSVSPL